jgi:hypothetical protein
MSLATGHELSRYASPTTSMALPCGSLRTPRNAPRSSFCWPTSCRTSSPRRRAALGARRGRRVPATPIPRVQLRSLTRRGGPARSTAGPSRESDASVKARTLIPQGPDQPGMPSSRRRVAGCAKEPRALRTAVPAEERQPVRCAVGPRFGRRRARGRPNRPVRLEIPQAGLLRTRHDVSPGDPDPLRSLEAPAATRHAGLQLSPGRFVKADGAAHRP